MPFFGWRCPTFDGTALEYRPKWEPGMYETCKKCDCVMERDLTVEARTHVPGNAFPYVTRNITRDGSPVEVTSLAHLRQLEKIHGVRNRDDADFIDEQWQGYDPRSGEQQYGGGRGGGRNRWV